MDRNIVTKADAAKRRRLFLEGAQKGVGKSDSGAGQITSDGWTDKLLKYIPVEAVGLYLALEGAIRAASLEQPQQRVWLTIILAVVLVFSYFYLKRVGKVVRGAVNRFHSGINCVGIRNRRCVCHLLFL